MKQTIPDYNKPTLEQWVEMYNENFRLRGLREYQRNPLRAALETIENKGFGYWNGFNNIWLVRCLKGMMTYQQMLRWHAAWEVYYE